MKTEKESKNPFSEEALEEVRRKMYGDSYPSIKENLKRIKEITEQFKAMGKK